MDVPAIGCLVGEALAAVLWIFHDGFLSRLAALCMVWRMHLDVSKLRAEFGAVALAELPTIPLLPSINLPWIGDGRVTPFLQRAIPTFSLPQTRQQYTTEIPDDGWRLLGGSSAPE
jgi:hypothetical protein